MDDAAGQDDRNRRFSDKIMQLYRSGEKIGKILDELLHQTTDPDGCIDLSKLDDPARSIHPWDMLGNALREDQRYDEAEDLYHRLISLMRDWMAQRPGEKPPLLGLAHNDLGLVYYEQGFFELAARHFWQAFLFDLEHVGKKAAERPAAHNLSQVIRHLAKRGMKRYAVLKHPSINIGELAIPTPLGPRVEVKIPASREAAWELLKREPAQTVLDYILACGGLAWIFTATFRCGAGFLRLFSGAAAVGLLLVVTKLRRPFSFKIGPQGAEGGVGIPPGKPWSDGQQDRNSGHAA